MSRERRRELSIPELKQDQDQPSIGEEQFQYLLQLLTTYENNNIKRMRSVVGEMTKIRAEVVDTLSKYKEATAALSRTVLNMETKIKEYKQDVASLAASFSNIEVEMNFMMRAMGYYDVDGDFQRPKIAPERDEPKELVI